ncbi:6388_t:CDS:2 [Cetraspora pellucida]|uniref:6388_t:CDS:1 n=1 Tax=Cetraspora pellucida TaxID=1433469 RepID=A0A9N9FWI2_9GLOM|nr:6388_t:CDS:2 [Cetraspora pellucida]
MSLIKPNSGISMLLEFILLELKTNYNLTYKKVKKSKPTFNEFKICKTN